MKKIQFFIALLLIVAAGTVKAQSSPDGSWSDEANRDVSWGSNYTSATSFTINDEADFAQFAYLVNNETMLYTFENKTVKLAADLDLSGHAWVPVGNSRVSFKGIFDGAGHTISGVNVDLPDEVNVGLFGVVTLGQVKDLVLQNSTFRGRSSVGGIVGMIVNTKVDNCHTTETVKIIACQTINGYITGFGGIVGETYRQYSGESRPEISFCSSGAQILFDGNNPDFCKGLGGILGNAFIDTSSGAQDSPRIIGNFYYGTERVGKYVHSDEFIPSHAGTILGQVNSYGTIYSYRNSYYPTTSQKAFGNADGSYDYDTNDDEQGIPVYKVSGKHISLAFASSNTNDAAENQMYNCLNNYQAEGNYWGGYVIFNGEQYAGTGTKFKPTYTGTLPDDFSLTFTCEGTGASISEETSSYYGTTTTYVNVGTSDVVVIATTDGNWTGAGTKDDPYLISTPVQWKWLAFQVNNGTDTFSGENFQLGADISVTEKVGASEANSFQGIFDGNGHTLTFTANTSDTECAPFAWIKNATIRRLHTTGSITTSAMFAAGIVARAFGNCKLQACRSSMTITSSVSGDGTSAGLLAVLNNNGSSKSSLACIDCLFDGKLLTTNGTTHWGGFISTVHSNDVALYDCLFAPAELTSNLSGKTFIRDKNYPGQMLLINCYYTTALGTIMGYEATVSGAELAHKLGAGWDSASLLPLTVDQTLSGEGTEESPYYIYTSDDWRKLAFIVDKDENTLSSKFVMLAGDDVEASYCVGTSDAPFSGTFLGNGKTLVVSINENNERQGAAPFRYISDATIRDLNVTGSVKNTHSEAPHVAGLVGFALSGTNTIENCAVSATVNSYRYAGGLVGHGKTSTLNINNCAFTGSVVVDYASGYAGGLLGWSDGSTLNINNSIFAGDISGCAFHPIAVRDANKTMKGTMRFALYTTEPTLTDKSRIAFTNGIGAYTDVADVSGDGLYMTHLLGGNTYYTKVQVSTIEDSYDYNGSAIKPEITILDGDDENLVKDTDFSLAWTEENGKPGDYTLTVTAIDTQTDSKLYTLTGSKMLPYSIMLKWAGSGTEADPYVISNAQELDELSRRTNTVQGGYAFTDTYFVLANDIEYNGTFTPIGKGYSQSYSSRSLFRGIFDGQGHVISGITINSEDSDVGLFANNNGIIRNLAIKSSNITGWGRVGAIVGTNDGIVENCHVGEYVNVNTTESSSAYNTNVGGVVGYNYGGNPDVAAGSRAIVRLCSSAATIAKDCGQSGNHGGIVGSNSNGGKVEQCFYSGSKVEGGNGLGALVGNNSATVSNSFWTNGRYQGNSIGKQNGTATNCGRGADDMADNTAFITTYNALRDAILQDQAYSEAFTALAPESITLIGRTLWKDGSWNTLCLPFDLKVAGSLLDGATVMELDTDGVYDIDKQTGFDAANGTIYLYFKPARTIEAGKPYIVKWETEGISIADPNFGDISTASTTTSVVRAENDGLNPVEFIGTFGPENFAADNGSIVCIDHSEDFYIPGSETTVNAFRAYFQADLTGGSTIRSIVTNINRDVPTGIANAHSTNEDATWFSINGLRLNGTPSQPGVYISNGRKVVVK